MARKGRHDRGLLRRRNAAGQWLWHVRVGIGHGKEKWFGPFPTKTKAREHYEKCKHEQAEQQFNPERYRRGKDELLKMTIQRFLNASHKRTRKDDAIFGTWWTTHYGEVPLRQLSPAHIEEAMGQLQQNGYTKGKGKKKVLCSYAPQTILHYMKFLRHVLNLAVRDGQLDRSPFAQVKLPRINQGGTNYLSPEEETRLLRKLGPTYGPWARLAILTGLRKGEQFSLRWQDVDLELGLITLSSTKAGHVQYVPLNEEAKGILRSLISWQRSPWVFPSENPSTHLDLRNFYARIYAPAVKEVGLERVTWHTLRHTFASRLAMNGQTEGTIASLLRHSSTALVRRYAHLSPDHLRHAVEGISTFGKPDLNPNRAGTVQMKEGQEEGENVNA